MLTIPKTQRPKIQQKKSPTETQTQSQPQAEAQTQAQALALIHSLLGGSRESASE